MLETLVYIAALCIMFAYGWYEGKRSKANAPKSTLDKVGDYVLHFDQEKRTAIIHRGENSLWAVSQSPRFEGDITISRKYGRSNDEPISVDEATQLGRAISMMSWKRR